MNTRKILTVLIALFLSASATQAQTVDDVIGKYVNAIGGMDKLKAIKTLKLTMILPQGAIEIPIVMTTKRPDKMRMDITFQGMSQVTAFNGKTAWMINPFAGKTDAEKLPEDATKDLKDQSDIDGSMVDYKSKGYKAELLGKEDWEGTEVYKVRIAKNATDYDTHFIDASTYMLLKTASKRIVKEKETVTESMFSDYRAVDGVLMAYGMEVKSPEATEGQKMTMKSIEPNVAVDDSIFEMPAAKTVEPAEKK